MWTSVAQHDETTSSDRFALQNAKLLKVRLDVATVRAKRGAMVAYQGDVTFEHAGAGGLGRFVKRAVTGEGVELMEVSGTGEVFLADRARDVHLVALEDEGITVGGAHVLAFDAGVDWDVRKVKGTGAAVAGGLFNMVLEGTGWVAVLTDGPPVRLDVGRAPTFADAQAAIAWSSGVTASIRTDFKLRNLVGRGSGESLQLGFAGEGWVLVAPSEARAQSSEPSDAAPSRTIGDVLRGD